MCCYLVAQWYPTLCDALDSSMPGPLSITNSQSSLILMSIEPMMVSNHLILCHSLLLLPSVFPSIRVFSKESALHIRWPKYWSFNFSMSPPSDYSGWISFRIAWFDWCIHEWLNQWITRKLVGNVNSQAPPRITESETLGLGPSRYVLTSCAGYSDACLENHWSNWVNRIMKWTRYTKCQKHPWSQKVFSIALAICNSVAFLVLKVICEACCK